MEYLLLLGTAVLALSSGRTKHMPRTRTQAKRQINLQKLSPSRGSKSPSVKLIDQVDPTGPSAGLHDQREPSDTELPSSSNEEYKNKG